MWGRRRWWGRTTTIEKTRKPPKKTRKHTIAGEGKRKVDEWGRRKEKHASPYEGTEE